jgi:hypothetical protein
VLVTPHQRAAALGRSSCVLVPGKVIRSFRALVRATTSRLLGESAAGNPRLRRSLPAARTRIGETSMAHKARRRGSWKLSAKDATRRRAVIPVTIA